MGILLNHRKDGATTLSIMILNEMTLSETSLSI